MIDAKTQELLALPPNWDSYGALGLLRGAAGGLQPCRKARRLARLLESKLAVTPTTSGGVTLEWHDLGMDLEIDVGPEGISIYLRDEAGDYEGALEKQ